MEAVAALAERWRSASGAVFFMPPSAFKTLDEWIAPRRAAALARVIGAVGMRPHHEARLAADIFEAYCRMRTDLGVSRSSQAKNQLKKVKRILKLVDKADAMIASDTFIRARINNTSTPFELSPTSQLLLKGRAAEAELILLAKKRRVESAPTAGKLNSRRPSELEWLAGVLLPLVYERHFLRRAGRSQSAEGEPGGPTVRFAKAVLKELGLKNFKRASIVRAFTRLTPQRDEERARRRGETHSGRI